jgi:hypothetical protein
MSPTALTPLIDEIRATTAARRGGRHVDFQARLARVLDLLLLRVLLSLDRLFMAWRANARPAPPPVLAVPACRTTARPAITRPRRTARRRSARRGTRPSALGPVAAAVRPGHSLPATTRKQREADPPNLRHWRPPNRDPPKNTQAAPKPQLDLNCYDITTIKPNGTIRPPNTNQVPKVFLLVFLQKKEESY